MAQPMLTPDAEEILRRARSKGGVFAAEVLRAAMSATGACLPPEVQDAAAAGGHPFVERLADGFVRLHSDPARAERALVSAAERRTRGARPIEPKDLLQTVLETDERLVQLASKVELEPEQEPEPAPPAPVVLLGGAGQDLTAAAPLPVAAREEEVAALMVRLARRENPGAVIVGHPRAGRRSCVLRLANVLAGHDMGGLLIPRGLRKARVVEIEMDMVAKTPGGRAELAGLLDTALGQGDILFFAGGDQNWLLTGLSRATRDALRFVLVLTEREYQVSCETASGGFGYLGAPLRLGDPSLAEARSMVAAHLPALTEHHGRTVQPEVVEVLVSWANDNRRPLPVTALEVLDESLAWAPGDSVGVDEVFQVIAASRRADRDTSENWFFTAHWAPRRPAQKEEDNA